MIRDDTGEDQPTHFLIWGDKNLTLATTKDLKNFTNSPGFFITTRSDHFDSSLVEAGPPPLRLSDKNYLFFYNSARVWYPTGKINYTLQYNVGFLILDKDDPSKILQRSDEPLLSPQTTWEIGMEPYLGLTPNVVFLEGAKSLGDDKFLIFYGASDSVVGAAIVNVEINVEANIEANVTSDCTLVTSGASSVFSLQSFSFIHVFFIFVFMPIK